MDVHSEVNILEDDETQLDEEDNETQLDEEDYFQSLKDGAVLTVCLANPGEASGSIKEKAKFLMRKLQNALKLQ